MQPLNMAGPKLKYIILYINTAITRISEHSYVNIFLNTSLHNIYFRNSFFTFSSNRTFLYLDITNIAKLHGILTVIAKSNQHLNVVVLCFMSFSSACGAYSVIMVHTFLVKNGNELYKEEIENTSEELNINFEDVYSHTCIMHNVDGGR